LSSVKKKAIVSACLLGERCRYDGQTKGIEPITKALQEYEIVPFCPEAPIFGTPRERISVVEIDGALKIVTDETNRDVTQLLENEIDSFLELHPKTDRIILKSKSPSCGFGTTPILNAEKKITRFGNGIAAERLQKRFTSVTIEDELSFG